MHRLKFYWNETLGIKYGDDPHSTVSSFINAVHYEKF